MFKFKILNILLVSWTFVQTSQSAALTNLSPANVQIDNIHDDGYTARVTVHGQSHQLRLTRPDTSVFSPNFSFLNAKKGPQGRTVFQPASSQSMENFDDIEQKIHVDKEAGAVVRVHRADDGQLKLHGIIKGLHITHNGQSHVATSLASEEGTVLGRPGGRFFDYVDTNVTLTYPSDYNPLQAGKEGVTVAEVELYLVLDNKQWTNLEDDHVASMEYVAIMVHGINAFYHYSEDPKITFKVVGLLTMNTTTQQPFMESARIKKDADGAFDMVNTLAGFASYMYANRDLLPDYDVAAFISGEEFKTYNETTEVWEKGIVGLAHRRSACRVNKESEKAFKTAVIKDMGAFWRGAYPLTHELGHTLGASHDGEAGAESCNWNDGHIMTYTGWGSANRFHFSSCSNDLMKNYINSNEGECLRSQQSPAGRFWNESTIYSGDKLNMDELCRKLNGGKQNYRASSTKTPTELCRMISCERCFKTFFGEVCGLTGSEAFDMMPGENTPCGKNGGKCQEGDCIESD